MPANVVESGNLGVAGNKKYNIALLDTFYQCLLSKDDSRLRCLVLPIDDMVSSRVD